MVNVNFLKGLNEKVIFYKETIYYKYQTFEQRFQQYRVQKKKIRYLKCKNLCGNKFLRVFAEFAKLGFSKIFNRYDLLILILTNKSEKLMIHEIVTQRKRIMAFNQKQNFFIKFNHLQWYLCVCSLFILRYRQLYVCLSFINQKFTIIFDIILHDSQKVIL